MSSQRNFVSRLGLRFGYALSYVIAFSGVISFFFNLCDLNSIRIEANTEISLITKQNISCCCHSNPDARVEDTSVKSYPTLLHHQTSSSCQVYLVKVLSSKKI